jgi:hypothetical protein
MASFFYQTNADRRRVPRNTEEELTRVEVGSEVDYSAKTIIQLPEMRAIKCTWEIAYDLDCMWKRDCRQRSDQDVIFKILNMSAWILGIIRHFCAG